MENKGPSTLQDDSNSESSNIRIYIMYISPQVVHRDLKLDNLLVDDKGRVIISDFGKAVVLDETMKVAYNHGELNTQHMYMVHGSTQQSNAVHVCNNSTYMSGTNEQCSLKTAFELARTCRLEWYSTSNHQIRRLVLTLV